MEHLCKSKELGGLRLPIIQHYYWAAYARALIYWQGDYLTVPKGTTPSWLTTDQDITGTSLPALLNTTEWNPGPVQGIGFIVQNSLRVCYQTKNTFKLTNTSIVAPICHNPTFPPSQSDPVFSLWKGKGLVTVKDLILTKLFHHLNNLKTNLNCQ